MSKNIINKTPEINKVLTKVSLIRQVNGMESATNLQGKLEDAMDLLDKFISNSTIAEFEKISGMKK